MGVMRFAQGFIERELMLQFRTKHSYKKTKNSFVKKRSILRMKIPRGNNLDFSYSSGIDQFGFTIVDNDIDGI